MSPMLTVGYLGWEREELGVESLPQFEPVHLLLIAIVHILHQHLHTPSMRWSSREPEENFMHLFYASMLCIYACSVKYVIIPY